MEAEMWAFFRGESLVKRVCGIQQLEGAGDVGIEEYLWAKDGAVDVAFCGEVDHRAEAVFCKEALEQVCIADVAMDEGVVGVFLERPERQGIACVGQLVEIDEGSSDYVKPVEYKIGTNKTRAACNEHGGILEIHTHYGIRMAVSSINQSSVQSVSSRRYRRIDFATVV